MIFFAFGVLLHFFEVIKPGTRAELVFVGKARNFFWEDGYCLVPSFMPILHNFGVRPLWSLKKADILPVYRGDRDVSIDHFQDQRLPRYNVNTQTSMFGMFISRISEAVFGWFLGIQKGDPELLFQRLGSRIIILSIVLGFIANTFYPNKPSGVQNGEPSASSASQSYDKRNNKPKSPEGKVMTLSQLSKGRDPIIPGEDKFLPEKNGPALHYFFVNESDPRKYFLFQEPGESGKTILFVKESLCAIIPAGRKIYFLTNYPPQNVLNMEVEVIYAKKEERYNLVEKIEKRISGNVRSKTSSWRDLYDNWNDVETENHFIIAQARTRDKLPEPEKSFGGIVCF
jgi:hypothetical protein